jgi:broad specificity phosphatase PhoE
MVSVMSGTVQWIRHGTCEDGYHRPNAHARPGSRLAPEGRAEAIGAADRLRDTRKVPLLIIPSPLPRALETAAILAALMGSAVADPDPVFTEWRAPDCVLGLEPAAYPPAYRDWKNRRASCPATALTGGESLATFAERARVAVARSWDLADRYGSILIVSHRLLIGAVAAIEECAHEPAELFTAASTFRLEPAQIWSPLKGL